MGLSLDRFFGVHGEGVHAANIGVRYVAYFQAIFPMSFHHTQIKVKPPKCTWRPFYESTHTGEHARCVVNSDPRWKTTAAVFFFLQPKVNSWAVFGRFSRTIFVLLMGRMNYYVEVYGT